MDMGMAATFLATMLAAGIMGILTITLMLLILVGTPILILYGLHMGITTLTKPAFSSISSVRV